MNVQPAYDALVRCGHAEKAADDARAVSQSCRKDAAAALLACVQAEPSPIDAAKACLLLKKGEPLGTAARVIFQARAASDSTVRDGFANATLASG